MKFRIFLSSNKQEIPYNYSYYLCGVFHKWLGPNDLHNMLSLYSLGWLRGRGRPSKTGLHFPSGATWDIGIYNTEIAERLVRGLLLKDFDFYGMRIRKADRLEPPAFGKGRHRFLAGSPVLLRKVEDDGTRTHVTYDRSESSAIMNRVMRKKTREADLSEAEEINLRFDCSYPNPKTKLVDVKGIKNRASICPVIAEGPPRALEFAWTVGAGELTGVGFGSLNHTGRVRNGA